MVQRDIGVWKFRPLGVRIKARELEPGNAGKGRRRIMHTVMSSLRASKNKPGGILKN